MILLGNQYGQQAGKRSILGHMFTATLLLFGHAVTYPTRWQGHYEAPCTSTVTTNSTAVR